MSKQLLCKQCDMIFTDESDLLSHFKLEHILLQKKGEGDQTSLLLEKIEEAFPDDQVNVIKSNSWQALYKASITHNGATMVQYIGTDPDIGVHAGNPHENDIQRIIEELQWKIQTADELSQKILSIGKFKEFSCTGFTYGYSDDEHAFCFSFTLENEEEKRTARFYPWGQDQSEEEFVNSFKQYFLKALEGVPSPLYFDGYFDGYAIDGVPIEHILQTAKRIRLQIVD